MLRLLWKELHELKWYLLALLLLPWAATPWGIYQEKVAPKDIHDLCFWVCMLPLAFWGSTRMGQDMQPNHLGSQWLPVNRWAGFVAKFAPGLIVAVLLPTWMRFVVTVCTSEPVPHDSAMAMVASSIFAFTFAASLFVPSLPAALLGVAFDMVACGWSIKGLPSYFPRDIIIGGLAAIAATACIGVWVQTERSSIRRRASGALTGIAVGLVPVLGISFLLSVHMVGGLKKFGAMRSQYLAQSKSGNRSQDSPYVCPPPLASPNGRSIAYVMAAQRDPANRTELVIVDIGGGRTTVAVHTASPATWLRNGDLLVFTGTVKTGVTVNRLYRSSNRLVALAHFPPCDGQRNWMRPVVSVAPDPSSERVALVVMPPSGTLPDLWVVDARKGNPRMIRRSLATEPEGDHLAWRGDAIVLVRNSEYWRMPLDGSRPRYITTARKEARRG